MPKLPEGTDRNRLVVVRPKDAPATPEGEKPIEHVVGAAWLQSEQGADDFEFVRFEGETQEQADAREKAAEESAAGAEKAAADAEKTPAPPKTPAPSRDF